MSKANQSKIVRALLKQHGETYAEELGISLQRGSPSALFRLLCASVLFSARIGAGNAVRAARALADKGWRTPRRMAKTTWEQRVTVLNRNGYARYDESTARMLGEDVDLVMQRYKGDLRNLRKEAQEDASQERRLLKEFKGIGDVGVDIFFREVQGVWNEVYPFADKKALKAARRVHLGGDAKSLSRLVKKADFPRLAVALVRMDLVDDYDAIRAQAK
jgi:hypothetical protein